MMLKMMMMFSVVAVSSFQHSRPALLRNQHLQASAAATAARYAGTQTTPTQRRMCSRRNASVSGTIYESTADDEDGDDDCKTTAKVTVKLFTKEGCTLCDAVKDVLQSVVQDEKDRQQQQLQHTLIAVDITDPEHEAYFDRYKYDIPVLHMNDVYWTKHRLTEAQAVQGLQAAAAGTFHLIQPPLSEEPNAAVQESKQQAQRQRNTD